MAHVGSQGEGLGWPRRPNRSAKERRGQAHRAEARTVQRLLKVFSSLDHRGCRRSRLGAAMVEALSRQTDHTTGGHDDYMEPAGTAPAFSRFAPCSADSVLPTWSVSAIVAELDAQAAARHSPSPQTAAASTTWYATHLSRHAPPLVPGNAAETRASGTATQPAWHPPSSSSADAAEAKAFVTTPQPARHHPSSSSVDAAETNANVTTPQPAWHPPSSSSADAAEAKASGTTPQSTWHPSHSSSEDAAEAKASGKSPQPPLHSPSSSSGYAAEAEADDKTPQPPRHPPPSLPDPPRVTAEIGAKNVPPPWNTPQPPRHPPSLVEDAAVAKACVAIPPPPRHPLPPADLRLRLVYQDVDYGIIEVNNDVDVDHMLQLAAARIDVRAADLVGIVAGIGYAYGEEQVLIGELRATAGMALGAEAILTLLRDDESDS